MGAEYGANDTVGGSTGTVGAVKGTFDGMGIVAMSTGEVEGAGRGANGTDGSAGCGRDWSVVDGRVMLTAESGCGGVVEEEVLASALDFLTKP